MQNQVEVLSSSKAE